MTIEMIMKILKCGDTKGSSLKSLAKFYGCKNYDFSPITDEMANKWLCMQKCDCWHEGSCWGTLEQETCSCNGDITKCDFYRRQNHDA